MRCAGGPGGALCLPRALQRGTGVTARVLLSQRWRQHQRREPKIGSPWVMMPRLMPVSVRRARQRSRPVYAGEGVADHGDCRRCAGGPGGALCLP